MRLDHRADAARERRGRWLQALCKSRIAILTNQRGAPALFLLMRARGTPSSWEGGRGAPGGGGGGGGRPCGGGAGHGLVGRLGTQTTAEARLPPLSKFLFGAASLPAEGAELALGG